MADISPLIKRIEVVDRYSFLVGCVSRFLLADDNSILPVLSLMPQQVKWLFVFMIGNTLSIKS
ncbi:hypothetical protein DMA11_04995 [Marinilabiliaceae bacterium JC017]|nr:hypothetical protein DMA11_04995 [Marinilabiliaceae bacterium JC017]